MRPSRRSRCAPSRYRRRSVGLIALALGVSVLASCGFGTRTDVAEIIKYEGADGSAATSVPVAARPAQAALPDAAGTTGATTTGAGTDTLAGSVPAATTLPGAARAQPGRRSARPRSARTRPSRLVAQNRAPR
jgi:hypothetical protein